MNIIEYLLKASLGLSLFLAGYMLFYRQSTFFRLNRLYFLIGSLAALLLPLVNLKAFFEKPKLTHLAVINLVPSVRYVGTGQPVEQELWQNLSIAEALLFVGVLGMMVMFLRFLLQCLSLFWLKNKAIEVPFGANNWSKIARERLYFLKNPISPFSFFNWIFVSPSLHTPKELDQIITHEQVHVKQWHSIDVLMAEALVMVLWFNPLAWIWRSLLKQNLEFLTDQALLLSGINSKQYQYNLLKISSLNRKLEIVNHFNYKQLKTRIAMMNKRKSSKINALKIIFALPMVAILLTAFNKSTHLNITNASIKTTLTKMVTKANPQDQWVLSGIVTDPNNKALANAQVLVFKHNTSLEKMTGPNAQDLAIASAKTNTTGLYQILLSEAIVRVAFLQKGLPLQWLDVRKNWTADVKMTPDGSSDVKVIEEKSAFENKTTDTNAEAESSMLLQSGGDSLEIKKTKPKGDLLIMDNSTVRLSVKGKDLNKGEEPLFVMDGVELSDQNRILLEQTDPNNIAGIEVIKGDRAKMLYGEKGRNGVILITSKKHKNTVIEEVATPLENEIKIPVEAEAKVKIKKVPNKRLIKKTKTPNGIGTPVPVEVTPKIKKLD